MSEAASSGLIQVTSSASWRGSHVPVTGTTNAYENLTKNVEDRWNLVTRYLGQFDVNHKRILELERRIDQLEERIAELEGAGGGESAA